MVEINPSNLMSEILASTNPNRYLTYISQGKRKVPELTVGWKPGSLVEQ